MKFHSTISLAALFFGAIVTSTTIFADHHEKKEIRKEARIIIETEGEAPDLAEIMKSIEAEIGDAGNVTVIVDDGGNIMVDKLPDDAIIMEGHMAGGLQPIRQIHKVISAAPHIMAGASHMMPGAQQPMSEKTANCVLKNIRNANSDTAAHLVRQACTALNTNKES